MSPNDTKPSMIPRFIILLPLIIFCTVECLLAQTATTDPSSRDSDGDGYWDRPDIWVDSGEMGLVLRAGEDKNANGKYEPKGSDDTWETEDDEFDPTNPNSHPEYNPIIAIDVDKDGLTDELETAWGTAANDADSDDDGVKDGDEIFIYHTNPCVSDSDHDGVPDGYEVGLTYSASGDGRNPYNSEWFDHINKIRVFYFRLPTEQQTYYAYAFKPSAIENVRSDPNCCDSDFDQIWDLQELEADSDPMRGFARNPDQNTYTYRALKKLELPTYRKGWAPVNKQYRIYLNRMVGVNGSYQWQAPLTVSLGRSSQAVTLSIETIPATPSSSPYFKFNGTSALELHITPANVKSFMGQFKVAELVLICPNAEELTSLKINLIRGLDDTIQYSVGLNKYYLDPELREEYFGPNQ